MFNQLVWLSYYSNQSKKVKKVKKTDTQILNDLQKLYELYEQGAITEKEYNEMKDLLDDDESVSDFWISLTEKIAKDPANTEYTLWDLISEDEFVKSFLLSGHRQQETIIGRYSVVSRELEKINQVI